MYARGLQEQKLNVRKRPIRTKTKTTKVNRDLRIVLRDELKVGI